MKSLLYLNDILTEYADIISRHIRYRYGRGAAAYFIFKVFQNLLAEIGFGATLSFFAIGSINRICVRL